MPDTLPKAFAFLLGFGLALAVLTPPAHPASGRLDGRTNAVIAQLEQDLDAAVNGFRAERHLVRLTRRADLDEVARGHSRDMARRGYLAHRSPEGHDWVHRLGSAGIEGFTLAGENVGLTTRSDPNREILEGWIQSPVHLENLVGRPFNATGIGIARSADGTFYYTQLYLTFPR